MDIDKLIDAAAQAAVEQTDGAASMNELAAVLEFGKEARAHIWDRHYSNSAERQLLDEKLAASSLEFQTAVAAAERLLADEIADSTARRIRIRAENPNYFKEH